MENTEGLFLKAGSSIICWNMFNDAHTNRALITSLIKLPDGYLAGIKLLHGSDFLSVKFQ